jgi:hypothetical protein
MFNFDDPGWKQGPRVTSNELWFNRETNEGAVVVRQSATYAEFPLSKEALDRVVAGVLDVKISGGYVVLAKRGDDTVVCVKTVEQIVVALKGIKPRRGAFGEYWWLNRDGTPNTQGAEVEEIPF